jgi:hypothetical protein
MNTHAHTRIASLFIIALACLAFTSSAFAASSPAATTTSASSIGPTTAHLNGTINPNGQATTWYFEFGTSTSYGTKTTALSAGSGTKTVNESSSLSGLSAGTTYHYRIVASNASGTSFGADQSLQTVSPPAVATAATTNIQPTSGTLMGSLNPNGLSTSWYFEYGTTSNYGSRTATQNVASGHSTITVSAPLSSLSAGTTYHFRLVASSSAGTTRSADATFVTAPAVTLQAAALKVVHGETVLLSGTVSSFAPGVTVNVLAALGSSPFSQVGTAQTGANGTWTFLARPKAQTTYQASANGGISSTVIVGVAPAITLKVITKARFEAHVSAGNPLAGHSVQLQRLSNGHWVTLKRERLSSSSNAIFAASLLPPGASTLRIALSVNQAGAGLLAGFSRELVYHRS